MLIVLQMEREIRSTLRSNDKTDDDFKVNLGSHKKKPKRKCKQCYQKQVSQSLILRQWSGLWVNLGAGSASTWQCRVCESNSGPLLARAMYPHSPSHANYNVSLFIGNLNYWLANTGHAAFCSKYPSCPTRHSARDIQSPQRSHHAKCDKNPRSWNDYGRW